jgi:hypothetical protein
MADATASRIPSSGSQMPSSGRPAARNRRLSKITMKSGAIFQSSSNSPALAKHWKNNSGKLMAWAAGPWGIASVALPAR